MQSKKKILITGGCGFIGRNLIPLLQQQNYQVSVLDNLSVGASADIAQFDVELIEGDIRDKKIADECTKNVDAIVHLAAHTNVIDSQKIPWEDYEINVGGTLNMLLASRDNNVQRFIMASSNAPIGENEPPIDETKPARPLSPYGASKLAGEGYCSAFHGSYGLGTIILRFANVYGPNSGHKGSVVAKFLKDAATNGSLTIYGDGEQTRDFIHVEDLCHAIIAGIESDCGGETFQVATGIETSIVDLANMVKANLNQPIQIEHVPQRAGEIIKNYSDISKAKSELNWEPKMSLLAGLQETITWFEQANRAAH